MGILVDMAKEVQEDAVDLVAIRIRGRRLIADTAMDDMKHYQTYHSNPGGWNGRSGQKWVHSHG